MMQERYPPRTAPRTMIMSTNKKNQNFNFHKYLLFITQQIEKIKNLGFSLLRIILNSFQIQVTVELNFRYEPEESNDESLLEQSSSWRKIWRRAAFPLSTTIKEHMLPTYISSKSLENLASSLGPSLYPAVFDFPPAIVVTPARIVQSWSEAHESWNENVRWQKTWFSDLANG